MYFKINVHSQLAPAKLYIKYGEDQYVKPAENKFRPKSKVQFSTAGKKQVSLNAYYSTTNKEPSEENCMKNIESPQNCIILTPTPSAATKDKFDTDVVYLSLFSYSGCKVIMRVQFPE